MVILIREKLRQGVLLLSVGTMSAIIVFSLHAIIKEGKNLKKYLRMISMCFMMVSIFLMLDYKAALADSGKLSTTINLDARTNQFITEFYMPKDGKIKININVKDRGTVPGTLSFTIQAGIESPRKIKEITGITSTNGVKELEIELSKGEYLFRYVLSGAGEELDETVLGLNSETEILPTLPDNLSALSVHNINSFDDITDEGYERINFGDDAKRTELVLPFKVDKAGGILISLKQADSYDDLEAGIYQDEACTKPVDKKFLLSASDDSTDVVRAISEKGTYYVKFTYKNVNPNGISSFEVKIYSIDGGERTLSEGKATAAYQDPMNGKIVYKINVKDTKSFQFVIRPYGNAKDTGAYFRLLDKNKKQLTHSSYVVSQQYNDIEYDAIIKYYVINKGTYYLEVSAGCPVYQIQSIVYDVNKQAGSSKAKAKLLKNKAIEGYFTISDKVSKVDWYKFSVTTSGQHIYFLINYRLDGDIAFQILNSKGKVQYDSREETECLEGDYFHWADKKYAKGTYYVKVFKGSKNSSLSYAVILKD